MEGTPYAQSDSGVPCDNRRAVMRRYAPGGENSATSVLAINKATEAMAKSKHADCFVRGGYESQA